MSRRLAVLFCVLTLTLISGLIARAGAPADTGGALPGGDQVARGKYLVTFGGCHDCHTPWVLGPKGPAPDMARQLSGHPATLRMPARTPMSEPWGWAGASTMTAFAGPWGVSFTANLTPDKETGLGDWTEDMFIKTIRTGRHQGKGRALLPPMPWFNVAELTDQDLKAVFAYLRSLPPVKNRVPEPVDPPEAQ